MKVKLLKKIRRRFNYSAGKTAYHVHDIVLNQRTRIDKDFLTNDPVWGMKCTPECGWDEYAWRVFKILLIRKFKPSYNPYFQKVDNQCKNKPLKHVKI